VVSSFDHFEKMVVYSITYKAVIYSRARKFIATDLHDHGNVLHDPVSMKGARMHMLINKLQGLSDQVSREQYAKWQGVPLDFGSN